MPDTLDIQPRTDVLTTRLLKAPPEQVFRAFTDPRRLALWWGPHGFTSTFEAFDPRPGGHWRFVMHGPDGTDYPNLIEFDVLDAPSRIALRHLETGHYFELTIHLDNHEGRTHLTWRQRFQTPDDFDRPFVTAMNEQVMDRLEAEMTRTQ